MFKIQFLYLGARLQTFLYLLVILSPLPSMIISIGSDFVEKVLSRKVEDVSTVPQTQYVCFLLASSINKTESQHTQLDSRFDF